MTSTQRVVSLIASSTEIVCALGCGDRLVGRSHECDHPAWVARLPVLTAPKMRTDVPSGEIDRAVKEILRDALSVYRVDAEKLRDLRPDVIITQTQCEVCAVSEDDVIAALATWTGARPKVVSLEPNGLADVWSGIRKVAAGLGVAPAGEKLVADLQRRMAAIAESARAMPERPRVACIEWIDPLMASGNWTPELVAMAGGINLFGEAGKHAPWMTMEELVAKDPDIIVVLPCGFDLARTRQELPVLTRTAAWKRLRAVCATQVYLCDGNQFFNRPGPRVAESLEVLAEILHPESFHFGHEGTGWSRVAVGGPAGPHA